MDPKKLAQNLIKKNFVKFGGIRKECTYKSITVPSYDAQTGVVSAPISTSYAGIKIIFDEFSTTVNNYPNFRKDDSSILAIDKIAIFPVLDLAVIPKVEDEIVDNNSVAWRIKGVSVDPAEAHYELHVRPF